MPKSYFAYTRVSTVKQGTKGVSLQEQKSAIQAHADQYGLHISEWFEETVTAAKTGRVLFSNMMERLAKGEAQGLVIHKIDRSARNLSDWSALVEMIDGGMDVQVVVENYDLSSRGGRLSANIQAVVADDYVRNLRNEAMKGMLGRLKQGVYPLKAPVGYVDNGGEGALKTIHPSQGPLVKEAFKLYDSGQHGLISLGTYMHARGLRSTAGGRIGKNGYSRIFNNPFYYGKILIKTTGQTFAGRHEPLISKQLFDRVQSRLRGKYRVKKIVHQFPFRRAFKCSLCGYCLTGELQKNKIYYRCHVSDCPMKCVRQDVLIEQIDKVIGSISLNGDLWNALLVEYEQMKNTPPIKSGSSGKEKN